MFPNVSRWEHLFEQWTTDKTHAPAPYIVRGVPANHYYDRERRAPQIGPYMTLDTRRIGGTTYGSAWVRARDEVNRTLVTFVDGCWCRGETLSFSLVVWSADRALVVAEHSQILGGHWLGFIDPQSIPEELRHAPSEYQRLLAERGSLSPQAR